MPGGLTGEVLALVRSITGLMGEVAALVEDLVTKASKDLSETPEEWIGPCQVLGGSTGGGTDE